MVTYGTNPTLWDTDGDGFTDADEIEEGTDPLVSTVPEFARGLGLLVGILLIGLGLRISRRRRRA